MIRRLHLVALALLATIALSFAQVGQIPGWPPLTTTVSACSDTTLHTITATGAGSATVPSGCGHVALRAWGGGSGGGGHTTSGGGGAGGGFATNSAYAVTPGNTLWWSVAASVAGVSGAGTNGNVSWLNISSNAQPTLIAQGITTTAATGGGNSPGTGGGFGPTGASGFAGGGGGPTGSNEGGGGGGAGSGGNGATPSGLTGGAGGTPDGGAGGAGGNSGGVAGTAPGGGGGGAYSSGNGGGGASGQISYQFSAFLDLPPANDNLASYLEAV